MSDTFEGWAIVELMGHRRLGAYVSEAEIGGASMLRLEVPKHPWKDGCTCGSEKPDSIDHDDHAYHCAMFRDPDIERPEDVYATQFYSPSALYCLTPSTEEMARAVRSRPEPVTSWEIEPRQLPAYVADGEDGEDEPF